MIRKRSKFKILFLAWFDKKGLGTISENIKEICRLSKFNFDVLNLKKPFVSIFGLVGINFYKYDALIIHNTVSYNPKLLYALDKYHSQKIKDFKGLKIMIKQDDHYRTDEIIDFLSENNFDLLFSCLPKSEKEKVYPKNKLPNLKFVQILTGYVTDQMRTLPNIPQEIRNIDIGYRGSLQPWSFGKLAYEKQQIGYVFQPICDKRNLKCNISSQWEDRIFGDNWFRFLSSCKAVLGVESGASVFDFTGEIEKKCKNYLKKHPRATFGEVENAILAPYEGKIYYNQISPRHFEAAACRTLQIMYEGRYSDIFVPYRHFLPLQRDLKNLDKILKLFNDLKERKKITKRTFEEIIMNDKYHYSTFVKQIDQAIKELI